MSLRRFAPVAFVLACIAFIVAGGGCEAIVNGDVPGFKCDATFDGGTCPGGQRCVNETCVPCPSGNCEVNDCELIDKDGDGYTLCGHLNDAGSALTEADCDDSDGDVHPNAPLQCNGKDNNCDGVIDDPCPTGQTCAPALHQCIDSSQACTTNNCPAPKVCDPGTKQCVLKGATKVGDPCQADSECESGAFCAYSPVLTGDIVSSNGLCTKPCCTSADCPTDFACFGAGTGGNYCVAKGALGRPALGEKGGGEDCSQNADCRSGICSNTKCQDTCCSSGQCASGTKCRVMSVQGKGATSKYVLGCGVPPSNATTAGNTCETPWLLGVNPPCIEGVCDNNGTSCRAPCCSSSSCSTTCDNTVGYKDHTDAVTACSSGNYHPGAKQLGEACEAATDCAGNRCYRDSKGSNYCSDACCTDADCKKDSTGLVCRPYDAGSNHYYLRCLRPAVAAAVSTPPQ